MLRRYRKTKNKSPAEFPAGLFCGDWPELRSGGLGFGIFSKVLLVDLFDPFGWDGAGEADLKGQEPHDEDAEGVTGAHGEKANEKTGGHDVPPVKHPGFKFRCSAHLCLQHLVQGKNLGDDLLNLSCKFARITFSHYIRFALKVTDVRGNRRNC